VAGKSSLARVGVGSGAAGDAHAELGSTAMGARRWRRIGNGIAQMDACIERWWRRQRQRQRHYDSSSPLSALDSASPSDPHATKLAPSPASHYSVESLIRTSGQACCMRKTVRLLLGTTLNSMHVATQGE